jgi:type II secretory ATPase GspE/PulE/Tfp pilus assembly ATPase PilB-like protein
MDMDVEPYIVASTVNVIVALRLVRKICDMCKSSYSLSLSSLIGHIPQDTIVKNFGQAQNITVFKGIGCKLCHFTGYSSRIGIFEVLEVTKNLKRQISEAKDSEILKTEAIKEGMTTMLDDGLQKAKQGLTTVEEVLRVTKVESV